VSLVDFPILGSLSEADRRRVLASTSRRTFARRAMLFHTRDPGNSLHLIAKGRVAVRITTPNGEQATLDVLGAGNVAGIFAVLGVGLRRTASVEALEPTETLSISQAQFQALRRAHPTIDQFVIDVLLAAVQRVDRLLLEALYDPVELRLLRRLLDLTRVYALDEHDATVQIALTQQDLASMAGTSRSTANQVLRQLEEAGVVRLSRNRIHVLDRVALQQRVG